MSNNRLLVIAIVLISAGSIGVFASTLFSGYQWSGGMSPMMGMMNRDQMKEMMQRMMPGMLPKGIIPEDLPDPDSRGARLVGRYCSQCHELPSPVLHTAQEWPPIADRMFARMSMMSGMMNVDSPSPDDQERIVAYLKQYARK